MKYTSFKDMDIWKKAVDVAEDVFKITDSLPRKEDYGFTSQIRRSSLSISANIAEAFGRDHKRDKVNFYYFDRGSVVETQSHLEYGSRVGYVEKDNKEIICRRLNETHKDLNKLIKALKMKGSSSKP